MKMKPSKNRKLHKIAAEIWGAEGHNHLSAWAEEMFGHKSLKEVTNREASEMLEALRQTLVKNAYTIAQGKKIRLLTNFLLNGNYKRLNGIVKRQTGKDELYRCNVKEASKIITGLEKMGKEEVFS